MNSTLALGAASALVLGTMLLQACSDDDTADGASTTSTATATETQTETGTGTDTGPACPANTECVVPAEPLPAPNCEIAVDCATPTSTFVQSGSFCFDAECVDGPFGEGACDTWETFQANHPDASNLWDCPMEEHGPYLGSDPTAECCYLIATPETSTSTATGTSTGTATGTSTGTATGTSTGTATGTATGTGTGI